MNMRAAKAASPRPGTDLGSLDRAAVEALIDHEFEDLRLRRALVGTLSGEPFAGLLTARGASPARIRRGSLAHRTVVDLATEGWIVELAAARASAGRSTVSTADDLRAAAAEAGPVEAAWTALAGPNAAALAGEALALVAAACAPVAPAAPAETAPVPAPRTADDAARALQAIAALKESVRAGDAAQAHTDKRLATLERDARARLNALERTIDGVPSRELEARIRELEARSVPAAAAVACSGVSPADLGAVRADIAALTAGLDALRREVAGTSAALKLHADDDAARHALDAEAARILVGSALRDAADALLGAVPSRQPAPVVEASVEPIAAPAPDLNSLVDTASRLFAPAVPDTLLIDGHNVINGRLNSGRLAGGNEPAAREWLIARVVELAELFSIERVHLCFDTFRDDAQSIVVSPRVTVRYAPRREGGADALIRRLIEEGLPGADVLVVSSDVAHVWQETAEAGRDGWTPRVVHESRFFDVMSALDGAADAGAELLTEAAHDALERMPEAAPASVRPCVETAATPVRELLATGRYAEAIESYSAFLERNPRSYTHLLGRARARRLAGDLTGAQADMDAAQRIAPAGAADACAVGDASVVRSQDVPLDLLRSAGAALAAGDAEAARERYQALSDSVSAYHATLNACMVELAGDDLTAARECLAALRPLADRWDRQVAFAALTALASALDGELSEADYDALTAIAGPYSIEHSALRFLAWGLAARGLVTDQVRVVFDAIGGVPERR